MSAVAIESHSPSIQVSLQFFNRQVNLAGECHLVEFLQDNPVKPLTDALGLRIVVFDPGVFNVVQRQIEQVVMVLRLAAIFRPTVGQDA